MTQEVALDYFTAPAPGVTFEAEELEGFSEDEASTVEDLEESIHFSRGYLTVNKNINTNSYLYSISSLQMVPCHHHPPTVPRLLRVSFAIMLTKTSL